MRGNLEFLVQWLAAIITIFDSQIARNGDLKGQIRVSML